MLLRGNRKYLNTFLYPDKCLLITRLLGGLNLWDSDLTTEIKHKIESHWSKHLNHDPEIQYKDGDRTKEKYYVLSMFPYPSGQLHMGHVRVYTISDSIARYQRMNDRNVIHPIGWDAFGLPAENAAIDKQTSPQKWTQGNIKNMKEQLQHLGCSFEWDRELATCNPDYYKWTQELFLKLYDAGLAYQKEALVNWDPVDCTVLADEQVDDDGCSWRSGAKVEKKLLKQWFVKTTKYAKALQDGLDDSILHDWRDIIKLQQHWIGECSGIAVDFHLKGLTKSLGEIITLWTDKPEYLVGVEFIVISSNHLLAKKWHNTATLDENTKILREIEAVNPLTDKPLKIYVTTDLNIKLPDGADCHLAMPSINKLDKEFAVKYNIPYENCVEPQERQQVIDKLVKLNAGGYFTSSKLRDWLISRQRYWGTPIPIIHCEKCGNVPVPREQLPVVLPECDQVSRASSVLVRHEQFKNVPCPKCGNPAKRETDTMDTFVDSSWYFLRYLNVSYTKDMFDVGKAQEMTPVDLYIGGKEHAVLHLYYARFISHFLHSLGMLPEREPFKRLLVQGMVMGRSFRIKGTGKYLSADKVDIINVKKNQATCKETGAPVVMQWEKMSKSKFNGTDPTEMFREYGVDTTRLLILADVAPTSHRNWNSNTFPGVINWQRRLWLTVQQFINNRKEMPEIAQLEEFQTQDNYMFDSRNYYVKGANFNYCDSQQISVAISKLQGLTNSIRKSSNYVYARSLHFERALACQIILMAPMAPHFASELWAGFVSAPNRLDNTGEIQWDSDVLQQKWPEVDWDYDLDLVCQINGAENAVVKISRKELEGLPRDKAISIAMQQDKIKEITSKRNVLSVCYKLFRGYEGVVNIVTSAPIKQTLPDSKNESETKTAVNE